jgi:putative molybdopterin biosynthesis protein
LGAQAAYVDTGDPLPAWANAVIPIENVEPLDEAGQPSSDARHPAAIRIRLALPPWQHVRPLGEDIVATQLVLPAGQVLRPVDLGAIAACGHASLRVVRKPRVAILPTGSELVPVGRAVRPGDILEYNSLVLAAQVAEWGGQAKRFPITPDDFEQIRLRVLEAAQAHDLSIECWLIRWLGDFSARGAGFGRATGSRCGSASRSPSHSGMVDRTAWRTPLRNLQPFQSSAFQVSRLGSELRDRQPLLICWLGLQPINPQVTATLRAK